MNKAGINVLPRTNSLGFFEIRMESIGGLGANLAGRILSEAGILRQGLNGSSFASYGSEKKGTPVKAFVRFCSEEQEVLINSPIENPHVIAVFHEALLKEPSTTAGLERDGALIVNSSREPREIAEQLGVSGLHVACVDALHISIEEKVKINTILLGTICEVIGFIDPRNFKEAIEAILSKRYAHLIEANLRGFDRGRKELKREHIPFDESKPLPPAMRPKPALGYENAPIGGVIETPGNMALKDLSLTRSGYIPVLDLEKCIHCAECDMTCPDYCFSWEKRVDEKGRERMFLKGIDYRYCKGCLRCVEICSPGALSAEIESMAEVINVPQLNLTE